VDLASISSPLERDAKTTQIRNFGQCPVQLFINESHPPRLCRTISIEPDAVQNKQSPATQGVDVLQQELTQAKLEIQRLQKELDLSH
jgi:hypothetical protein